MVASLQKAVICGEEGLIHGESLKNMSWLVPPPPATTTPVKWGLLPHRAGEKTEVAEGASA